MPVVTAARFTRPEEIVDALADLIEMNIPEFNYISRYDEDLIPEYPCCQIQPGDTSRTFHGTHTLEIFLRAFIFVMHDKMTISKRMRSEEDMKLATKVVDLLDLNITLGRKIIDGLVESEVPTALPPRTRKGDIVVCTRIGWVGKTQTRFK
jgi:hypothetical protein